MPAWVKEGSLDGAGEFGLFVEAAYMDEGYCDLIAEDQVVSGAWGSEGERSTSWL